jgi:UDP-N-acetylglucosamine 1-carboxyvinyltransferase
MSNFIINGGKHLAGEIDVRGSKNATTPILAATLLTEEPCIIDNLPLIDDVLKMLEILKGLGAEVVFLDKRKVKITAKNIDPSLIRYDLVNKLRSSVLIVGPLLARFKKIKISHPGGCVIGARPLDTHLEAIKDLGATIESEENFYNIEQKSELNPEVILREFSVTATENILMAAALSDKKITLKIAAVEPHVMELAEFLKKIGIKIENPESHVFTIEGQKKLKGAEHFIGYDPIEAGTFLVMASLLGKDKISVKNVPLKYMDLVMLKLKEFGVGYSVLSADKNSATIKIDQFASLKAANVQTLPYPGFPTDLQAPFCVFATQAQGTSLVHETMYEGRLRHADELQKMGANAIICDPHRVLISGPTPLYGREITSFDLRSGATLIIAALLAKGISLIHNIEQVDRGYEKIEERLLALGADIKRESN